MHEILKITYDCPVKHKAKVQEQRQVALWEEGSASIGK